MKNFTKFVIFFNKNSIIVIPCFFISDLHGSIQKYDRLFNRILEETPKIIFIGGDILPSGLSYFSNSYDKYDHFIHDYLIPQFEEVRNKLGDHYPKVFIIMGNDDPKIEESSLIAASRIGLWNYIANRAEYYQNYFVFGYPYIPPSPFRLKDWEKYDVSRFVDPGSIAPEDGFRTVPVKKMDIQYSTIQKDLTSLIKNHDLTNSVFLIHVPPYRTNLDRAALDGKFVDHVPLDVHIGSIAVKNFIERYQPYLTLHGHVHESTKLTGKWMDIIGRTVCINAAHQGKELSLVRLDLNDPTKAVRELI